jgi:predicted nuclease with TOPRIM domain
MSITLNHSDFQCLQDQLVDLKTKNYELAEKNRRSQADFEAAKAKICSLQLKLEEQERDFQVTSSTLRREIEDAMRNNTTTDSSNDHSENANNNNDDLKAKYRKLLHKAKELQQRYEKSLAVIHQMDDKIKVLTSKTNKLEEENKRLRDEFDDKQQKIATIEKEHGGDLNPASEAGTGAGQDECSKHVEDLNTIKNERDTLQKEVEALRSEVKTFNSKIESLAEERKMQDKKGAQMIKELKRQLTSEKNRNETLQKRLESLLSETTMNDPNLSSSNDLDRESRGASGSGGNNNVHCDDNSVSSWSLVAKGRTSTPSICSIGSEDRETIQLPTNSASICDTISQSSQHQSPSSKSISRLDLVSSQSSGSPRKQKHSSSTSLSQNSSSIAAELNRTSDTAFGLGSDDHAALIERVTRLQHDKWMLEEKLSYMEQANAALTQDLADKSQIVRQFFLDQAMKSAANHSMSHNSHPQSNNATYGSGTGGSSTPSSSRRVSFPNNFNQLLSDKPSLKKMVDFLKERGQVSSLIGGVSESETITREATKKMQIMLEETLIKCLKLQENLDLVTSELNKSKS